MLAWDKAWLAWKCESHSPGGNATWVVRLCSQNWSPLHWKKGKSFSSWMKPLNSLCSITFPKWKTALPSESICSFLLLPIKILSRPTCLVLMWNNWFYVSFIHVALCNSFFSDQRNVSEIKNKPRVIQKHAVIWEHTCTGSETNLRHLKSTDLGLSMISIHQWGFCFTPRTYVIYKLSTHLLIYSGS